MIRRFLIYAAGIGAAALALAGCQRDDSTIKDKLDQIDRRISSIEAAIAKGGVGAGRGQPQQQQRPQPNPADVYSVPIAGSPTVGAEQAKVTIVEAFEFA